MPVETIRAPGRSVTLADVLSAIRTLDDAAGSDSNYFRWRLRLWLRTEEQLAERQRLHG